MLYEFKIGWHILRKKKGKVINKEKTRKEGRKKKEKKREERK